MHSQILWNALAIWKWTRTGQLDTVESVHILHPHQTLQLQNSWGQEGNQENPWAKQKISWRISWLHYKANTNQQKNKPEVFLNDHTFSPESSGLNLTKVNRSFIYLSSFFDWSPHFSQVKSFYFLIFISLCLLMTIKQRKKSIYHTLALL